MYVQIQVSLVSSVVSGRCQPVDLSDVFVYDISGMRQTYSEDDIVVHEERLEDLGEFFTRFECSSWH